LCERACLSGSASRWERLEMRPTRFNETWCFHLWSHKSGQPVCYPYLRNGRSREGFVKRQPTFAGEMVIFSLQDFGAAAMEADQQLVAQANEAAPLLEGSQDTSGSVLGWMALSAQSAVARAWALPMALLPGPNLIGTVGGSLFASARSSAARPSSASRALAAAGEVEDEQSRSTKKAKVDASANYTETPAFTLISGSVADAESGEALDAGEVVRGTRRIEKISFQANQDLQDVTRIVKVTFLLMNFTSNVKMGDYAACQEPYEFVFPEQQVPRTSPPGTYGIVLSYVAANMKTPLYTQKTNFRMV